MTDEVIDINRLHKVYFRQLSAHGCGRTTLFATYLIGISELSDYNNKKLYVLCCWMGYQENVFMVCVETCKKSKIPYRALGKHVLLINKTKFVFCRDCIDNRNGRCNIILYDQDDF